MKKSNSNKTLSVLRMVLLNTKSLNISIIGNIFSRNGLIKKAKKHNSLIASLLFSLILVVIKKTHTQSIYNANVTARETEERLQAWQANNNLTYTTTKPIAIKPISRQKSALIRFIRDIKHNITLAYNSIKKLINPRLAANIYNTIRVLKQRLNLTNWALNGLK